jgi:CheY-like chemotaxis protein
MKVLIVNDDPVSLRFQHLMVERSKIAKTIVIATNGQEALDYFGSLTDVASYPALVFLDIDMPIMNGWQFLDGFTKLYLPGCPDTKVIITSITTDHERIVANAKEYPCVIDLKNTSLTTDYLKGLDL